MKSAPRSTPWIAILLAGLMLGYLAGPVLALLVALPGTDRSAYLGGGALPALRVTLTAATIAAAVDALLGIPLGYWLARTRSRLRHLVTAAVLVPLALPPVVGGLALVLWLGPHGWLGALLEKIHLNPLNTLGGTILAQMFDAAPFIVLSARAGFADVDPGVEDAARTLGCSPLQALVRVLLPAARQPLATGVVLGWVRCLGELGATSVVAYHPYTLPVLTYVRLTGEGLPAALPLGALLALVGSAAAAALLWLDARTGRRGVRPSSHAHPAEPAVPLSWIAPVTVPASPQPLCVRAVLPLGGFRLDVAFDAPPQAVALLGSSGAGKSLTLRVVAGLLHPRQGTVVLQGRVLLDTPSGVDVPPERRGLGYVLQGGALFDHLDVERNVGFALRAQPRAERERRVDELVASFGLERVRHAFPRTLSGGERHRVALARALAGNPSALLLDEPFESLDAPVRRELRQLVRRLRERTSIPVLLVTHDRDDVLDLADHVVVIEDGRVVQTGPTDEVFRRPATGRVARLLGIPNLLAVRSLAPAGAGDRMKVSTDWGEMIVEGPDRAGGTWDLAIPADAVEIDPRGTGSRILSVRPAGAGIGMVVQPSSGGTPLEALVPRGRFPATPQARAECGVAIDASRCHLVTG